MIYQVEHTLLLWLTGELTICMNYEEQLAMITWVWDVEWASSTAAYLDEINIFLNEASMEQICNEARRVVVGGL